MARTAVKLAAVLMVVMASACLDVCQACGECETPTPVYVKPPKVSKPPSTPKTPSQPKPPVKPPTTPTVKPPPTTCPVALAQLSVCSPLLGGILGGLLPPSNACCALLNLLGLDVEVCLCLALDANILGLISIDAKVDALISILTSCGYKVPPKLSCPH